MKAFKEEIIGRELDFPVDIFIQDNLARHIAVEPHWHDCLELLYMLEGSAEQQINEKRFTAVKDDLVILNEGNVHSTYCKEGTDTRILVVKFLPDVVYKGFSKRFESRYLVPFLSYRSSSIRRLPDTLKNSGALHKLMMELYEEFTRKETGYELYVEGYIYQLIALLIRNDVISLYNQPGTSSQSDISRLDDLFKYIEVHYAEHIDIQKAAGLMKLSASYFSRLFRKVTGSTFKEYLDFVRICEAEKLILSSAMNISNAAYEAGFCNVSSFNRVYRRVRGYPPGDIKRAITAKKQGR